MNNSVMIDAFLFARQKHKGQKDDEGKDYFEAHVVKVRNAVAELNSDKVILCAAILLLPFMFLSCK